VVVELTSTTLVKAAITPLIAQIHAPFQPRDRHPVASLAKKLLLNWRIQGVAFADSMDLAVADQMEVLENVYRVLAWSDAVKETARRINLVAYVSKEPRAERAMDLWAVRRARAKKIWSRPLSLNNSLTLQPTLDSYVYHANSLERCVVAADYQRQGYSGPLNMWLTSTALVAWANGHTAGRAPQVWAEIASRVLSDAGQTAFFGNFRKLKEALGPTKHRVYVQAFVSHYRYVKTDALLTGSL
jgi:hypothetical protein